MSIILSTLRDLARTLGCGEQQAETVVREERSARVALSRRGFFQAAGAVTAGICLVKLVPPVAALPPGTWIPSGRLTISGLTSFKVPRVTREVYFDRNQAARRLISRSA